MSIQHIKSLAKELDRNINDLLVLSPKNDPFYIGSKTHKLWADWIYGYWKNFGYSREVHIRRIHYQLVSQAETVIMPDGEPYENTEKCWKKLSEASKYLRYMGLIDCDQLIDRRSPPPLIFHRETDYLGEPLKREPKTELVTPEQKGLEVADFNFPPLEDLPKLEFQEIDHIPSYLMEIWCEKSTMNDILEPLCRELGINLVTGVGEISLTRCDELARRVKNFAKPTRIFYLSDFDPAGQSMPVAVSRKIEWLLSGGDYDVRVIPVLLGIDQVEAYRLPRIPIKETERRAARFETRYGEGATELDSLEALYPGELRRIILEALSPYLVSDRLFRQAVRNFNQAQTDEINRINENIRRRYQEEWDTLRDNFSRLEAEFSDEMRALFSRYEERLEGLRETREAIAEQIQDDLVIAQMGLSFAKPEPMEADEGENYLLNTRLSYLPQLAIYKHFQGKQAG